MQMPRTVLLLVLPCAAALNLLPQLRAAQPVVSRSSPLTMDTADEMASLQQQIERLQLQAKIKELQAQVAASQPPPEPVAEPVVTPPPAAVAKVAEVVKAPEVVAPAPVPAPVPEVAAPSPAEMADRIKDAMPSFSTPPAVPDFATAAPAADAATAGFNAANLPIAVAIVVIFLGVMTVRVRVS